MNEILIYSERDQGHFWLSKCYSPSHCFIRYVHKSITLSKPLSSLKANCHSHTHVYYFPRAAITEYHKLSHVLLLPSNNMLEVFGVPSLIDLWHQSLPLFLQGIFPVHMSDFMFKFSIFTQIQSYWIKIALMTLH